MSIKKVRSLFLALVLTLFVTMSIALPFAFAEDSWETKSPMPTGRFGLSAAEANGKIYAMGGTGGLNLVEEYDPVTDTWSTKANHSNLGNIMGVIGLNGKIYVIGGHPRMNSVEEYDPATDTWITKANMPTGRYNLGVTKVNGKIYAIGGRDFGNYYNTLEEYDPATDTWVTKASMHIARQGLGVAEVNGKIYAIGGRDRDKPVNTVEEYDPATDTWSIKANMPTGRYKFGVAKVNGIIYAIGGTADGGASYSTTVEAYTPPAPTTPNNPMNLTATAGDAQVVLNWDAVTDATGYNVKRSTTSGGPYDSVASAVYGTTYTDTGLTNGTTYYYVVSAIVGGSEGANSNEAVATPQQSGGGGDEGRAVLWVTMDNGSDIDYDLSMNEINAFINWYKSKASGGVGDPFYTFDKSPISPYTSRTDYLVFDKIVCFKVNKY